MSGISTLGQTLDQIDRIKFTQNQLDTIQRQITTGKKAELFKDLGKDALLSTRARESTAKLDNFVYNIDIAERRIKLMDSALDEIANQAQNMLDGINTELQEGEADFQLLGQLAENAFSLISDLLNEQDGDKFLFAGADSRTKPYDDTGTMDSYMSIQITSWTNGTITTDELIASYSDSSNLTDTIVGYSAGLSSGDVRGVTTRVSESAELDYTVLANTDGIRDIMSSLSMIKNLSNTLDEVTLDPDDPSSTVTAPGADSDAQNENFYRVLNNLASSLTSAIDNVRQDRLQLSTVGVQMGTIREDHIRQIQIQQDIIADIEDIDITEAAFQLNSISTQLEASYSVTAAIRQISLVNFL
jgi:flagellar hook-associated protein 3 FlgL